MPNGHFPGRARKPAQINCLQQVTSETLKNPVALHWWISSGGGGFQPPLLAGKHKATVVVVGPTPRTRPITSQTPYSDPEADRSGLIFWAQGMHQFVGLQRALAILNP